MLLRWTTAWGESPMCTLTSWRRLPPCRPAPTGYTVYPKSRYRMMAADCEQFRPRRVAPIICLTVRPVCQRPKR